MEYANWCKEHPKSFFYSSGDCPKCQNREHYFPANDPDVKIMFDEIEERGLMDEKVSKGGGVFTYRDWFNWFSDIFTGPYLRIHRSFIARLAHHHKLKMAQFILNKMG